MHRLDEEGNSVVNHSVLSGRAEIVAKLIQDNANVELANYCRNAALLVAAYYGHFGTVEKLIVAGSAIDHVNKEGISLFSA